jgi:hypothetical protein
MAGWSGLMAPVSPELAEHAGSELRGHRVSVSLGLLGVMPAVLDCVIVVVLVGNNLVNEALSGDDLGNEVLLGDDLGNEVLLSEEEACNCGLS